jgi:hypothetical protein
MKLIEKLNNTKTFISGNLSLSGTCAIVGNSGKLLDSDNGALIDSHDIIVRFNGAKTNGYLQHCGAKTTIRIMNCHYILNMENENYFKHQKSRFPAMERDFLLQLRNEIIIFKTNPSWKLWNRNEVLKQIDKTNKVLFFSNEFYNLAKQINDNKEASNGLIALLLALKYFKEINCYGFSFYHDKFKGHYYEEIKDKSVKSNHNFDKEKKIFELFQKNSYIRIN